MNEQTPVPQGAETSQTDEQGTSAGKDQNGSGKEKSSGNAPVQGSNENSNDVDDFNDNAEISVIDVDEHTQGDRFDGTDRTGRCERGTNL